jgi:8-oxo-dGTP pyrophosphatase MutT (NUDIX family)
MSDRESQVRDGQQTAQADGFIRRLQVALEQPLPGVEAQLRMAPRLRRPDVADRWRARLGGVLILFYPHNNQITIPFILRPIYQGVHSGQIGFPGGGKDEIDPDLTATALREAYEEISVDPQQVQVLGHLSELHITASNYIVLPTVAWIPQRPRFRLDPYEVAGLIEAPLAALLDPANQHEEEWILQERRARVPFYSVHGQVIWGATAMMVSELLAVIKQAQQGDLG